MLNNREFMKRRIEDAAFNSWLFRKEYEKNLNSFFSLSLAEEYKRKYENLLIKYSCEHSDESENPPTIWYDDFRN